MSTESLTKNRPHLVPGESGTEAMADTELEAVS
jgi:hypothetical protein